MSLKANIFSPPRASKVEDLNKVLTDWKHNIDLVEKDDCEFQLNDDTRMTLLIKMAPKEYVKDLREKYLKPEYKDRYHMLEQALYDEILTRKMDDEAMKGGHLGACGLNPARDETDEKSPKEEEEDEYIATDVWVEEYQCWIAGLAKRSRDDDDDGEEREDKRQRGEPSSPPGAKPGKGGGKKGEPRPGGPCWSCGGHTSKASVPITPTRAEAKDTLSQLPGHPGGPVPSLGQPLSNGTPGSPNQRERAKVAAAKEKERVKAKAKVRGSTICTTPAGGGHPLDKSNPNRASMTISVLFVR